MASGFSGFLVLQFPRAPPVRRNASGCPAAMEGSPCKRVRYSDPSDAPGIGKISALSDDVILHIMSFMNARQAVQTCVLSRRWRNLWRFMPSINADFFEFSRENEDLEEVAKAEVLFKRFVNRLLELRDPTIMVDTFWLRYSMSDEDDIQPTSTETSQWISYAIQKHTWSVELVAAHLPLEIDYAMFTSRYLRKVGLCNVELMTQGFFKQLEMGCPVLEDLNIDSCVISDDEISSQTVKVLTIKDTEFSHGYRTSISTPGVTFLSLCSPELDVPTLMDMPSLVTASLDLNDKEAPFDANDMQQFLWSLSRVKQLKFRYDGEELTIKNNLQWCPEFNNLVQLTLDEWCLDTNFSTLIVILQKSPRLEKLTLEFSESASIAPRRIFGELEERSFIWEHLKIVEIICLKHDPLIDPVEELFVKSGNGMTSVQIDIKHYS